MVNLLLVILCGNCIPEHCAPYHKEGNILAERGIINIEYFAGYMLRKEVYQRSHQECRDDCADTDIVYSAQIAADDTGQSAADYQSNKDYHNIGDYPNPFVRNLGTVANHKAKTVVRANAHIADKEKRAGKAQYNYSGNEQTDTHCQIVTAAAKHRLDNAGKEFAGIANAYHVYHSTNAYQSPMRHNYNKGDDCCIDYQLICAVTHTQSGGDIHVH